MEVILSGRHVTLYLLNKVFFTDYFSMFSSIIKSLLCVSSVESERNYINDRLVQLRKQDVFFYCIFDNTDNCLIGAIEIRDQQQCAGQLYSWLNERYWGGGRYQESLDLITKVYFKHANVSYYTARVDVKNKRSYYALKKYGFADAGLFQGPHGKQYDLIVRRARNT